mmetsp:Transcript_6325/g.10337  ORF Transcript_6325/g.10337 Transcript_6325/m.10337 type:complete len:203 (-) Transcript_6325:265-873(-)
MYKWSDSKAPTASGMSGELVHHQGLHGPAALAAELHVVLVREEPHEILYREELLRQRHGHNEVLAGQVAGVAAEVQLAGGVVSQAFAHRDHALGQLQHHISGRLGGDLLHTGAALLDDAAVPLGVEALRAVLSVEHHSTVLQSFCSRLGGEVCVLRQRLEHGEDGVAGALQHVHDCVALSDEDAGDVAAAVINLVLYNFSMS